MMYKQFFSEFGKLLYAIADVDGSISQKEKSAIHEIVNKQLIPLVPKNDCYGTNVGYYSEFEFDIMEDASMDPEIAFESFISFIQDHQTAIDSKMIEATRKVAETLADTYHHSNKKEKKLLLKLNKKLDEIEKIKHLHEGIQK